jgi:hypothetical protein
MKNSGDKNRFWLPDYKLETLANCFLPSIREYYETPEGQEAFVAWQQEQEELRNNKG